MSADPSLLDKLGNFLKAQQGIGDGRLQEALVCPSPLVRMQELFPQFEWACIEGSPPRLAGVRRLVGPTPFRLSDFRALGFRTDSVRHAVRPPVAGGTEHYLIAELLTPHAAKVYLCMHVPPD